MKNNWKDLRVEIEQIIRDKNLSIKDFRTLNILTKWKAIEEQIYQIFCKLNHAAERPMWLWEYFKQDTFSMVVEQPYKHLDRLVDSSEMVWLFVTDDSRKLWFYEGAIKAVITVIGESSYLEEVYIASKQYKWLICVNHHDVLIATGQIMPDRLRHLEMGLKMQNNF